jgi:hypothetical protein
MPISRRLDKLAYSHNEILYSIEKKSPTDTRDVVTLKNIIKSQVSQSEKNMHYGPLFIKFQNKDEDGGDQQGGAVTGKDVREAGMFHLLIRVVFT